MVRSGQSLKPPAALCRGSNTTRGPKRTVSPPSPRELKPTRPLSSELKCELSTHPWPVPSLLQCVFRLQEGKAVSASPGPAQPVTVPLVPAAPHPVAWTPPLWVESWTEPSPKASARTQLSHGTHCRAL